MANQSEDLDLDFHVQFPSPADTDNCNEIASIRNRVLGTLSKIANNKDTAAGLKFTASKDVVVILLGWAGAQDKYLAKYSEYYRQQGCIVLRYISPMKVLFVDTQKIPILAARLVKLLKDLQLETHPTFFHVFSNGGGFLYSYVLRELAALQDFNIDLRGTIFDSSPSPRNLSTVFRALRNIFSNFGIFSNFLAGCVVLILILQVFWYHLKSAAVFCIMGESMSASLDMSGRRHEDVPLQNWLGRIGRIKNSSCLFIYSEADELIPFSQVDMFADALEKRGNRVERLKFIDSSHVQHYRMYPEEYTKALGNFIERTMEESKGPTVFWKEF